MIRVGIAPCVFVEAGMFQICHVGDQSRVCLTLLANKVVDVDPIDEHGSSALVAFKTDRGRALTADGTCSVEVDYAT